MLKEVDPTKHKFFIRAAETLNQCQALEFVLKAYITDAFALVKKCVDGKLVFRMEESGIEGWPLERLVKTFRLLTDNEQLCKDLRTFQDRRNELAHRAIAACMDPNGDLDDSEAGTKTLEFEETRTEALRLTAAVVAELNTFRGYLEFTDLTDDSKSPSVVPVQ